MRPFTRYPGYTWSIAAVQALFVLVLAYWIPKTPSAGKAVAALAVAGVIMAVRTERFTLPEKVVWIVVGFGLLTVESRAIDNDRNIHDEEQMETKRQETQHFEKVVSNLQDLLQRNQSQFAETIGRLDDNLRRSDDTTRRLQSLLHSQQTALALSKQSLDQLTGGDDYPYFLVAPRGPLHPPSDKWPLVAMNSGNVPIPEVSAFITELPKPGESSEQAADKIFYGVQLEIGTIHPLMQGGAFVNYSVAAGRYSIIIRTRNTQFFETLSIEPDKSPDSLPDQYVMRYDVYHNGTTGRVRLCCPPQLQGPPYAH